MEFISGMDLLILTGAAVVPKSALFRGAMSEIHVGTPGYCQN
jgi:hypothetical protein